jgi:SAM-dependent methyltransferase
MSSSVETFQLSVEAAEAYEARFVPALFAEWAGHLVEAAGIGPGRSVLDVACGTGAVTRVAAEQVGDGRVVGLDLNEAMLAVARRIRPDLEWCQADAGALPFEPGSFDVVLCQSALMFFPDPVGALREMRRVARSTGTVGVQVWSSLDSQPGFRLFAEIVARHAGPESVDLVTTYFALGDLDAVTARFAAAGLDVTGISTRVTTISYASIDEAVAVEVNSTPLGDQLTEEAYARILTDTRAAFRPFAGDDGTLALPIEGHLILARPGVTPGC